MRDLFDRGTISVLNNIDYLVCSKKFAADFAKENDLNNALEKLFSYSKCVVITLGKNGLIWKSENSSGKLPAYRVNAVDTTGAGDVFHGAFALGVAQNLDLKENLKCQRRRLPYAVQRRVRDLIPLKFEVLNFLKNYKEYV